MRPSPRYRIGGGSIGTLRGLPAPTLGPPLGIFSVLSFGCVKPNSYSAAKSLGGAPAVAAPKKARGFDRPPGGFPPHCCKFPLSGARVSVHVFVLLVSAVPCGKS